MSISARMVKRAGTRRNGTTVVSHCGGSVMGASLLAKGIFHVELEGVPGASCLRISVIPLVLLSSLWPAAIIYRKHRDCGTTRHAKTDMSNVGLLMRLWGVVLLGNILGQVLRRGHLNICQSSMKKLGCICQNRHGCDEEHPQRDVCNAIISGWLIATMVWMFPAAGRQRLW